MKAREAVETFASFYREPAPGDATGSPDHQHHTPAGAAVQAMSDSWAGNVPQTSSLLVMAAYAVVAGSLAVWLFRWD